ncbi:hypothetical protein BGZ61DRAFT_180508 [Ilyonectria robusta]|uniref:uncharacterized protein n=1 Tax=Ilyonectria robusta TaxID=1079257 RepID=UPI001E8D66B4|nr:uncharacterized protein BGZ61DRAFT_180508 [Ilyonectria robusta]KAH8729384.1 hypothetical protein BGZ61DRAFT_180508 [Ilyonectria robusta]
MRAGDALGIRAGDARPAGDWRQARSPSPQLVCLLESLDEARALQPSQTQSVLMVARPTLVLTMATVDEFHLSSFSQRQLQSPSPQGFFGKGRGAPAAGARCLRKVCRRVNRSSSLVSGRNLDDGPLGTGNETPGSSGPESPRSRQSPASCAIPLLCLGPH